MEERKAMEEEVVTPGEPPLPPVKLVKNDCAKRKKTPEGLTKEAGLKIEEACMLEREADQLHQQGKPGLAERRRSKAKALRHRADQLQNRAVLLAKPDVARPSAWTAQHQGTDFCELVGVLQEEARAKTAPVSMGRVDMLRWLEMQSDAALESEMVETHWMTGWPTVPVPEYSWDERTSCERQIQHLRNIINTCGGETEWVNAARDYPELLSGQMLGHNITAATTDVLAAERSAVSAGSPQMDMRLLMDIRRTITSSDVFQSQARLLLGNLRCPKSRPALVLTDLIDEWRAMWLDGNTIYLYTFISRGAAVGFIQDLLAGRRTAISQRRQVEDRLCVNSAAEFAQQVKALSMPPPSMRSSS